MKPMLQKIGSLALSVILLCTFLPLRAAAGFVIQGGCQVEVDTGGADVVKTLDYGYEDNTYFSLRDMAMLLTDTEKSFSLEITKNAVSLKQGSSYTPVGTENEPWEDGGNADVPLRRNELKVNEETAYYYTLLMELPSGDYDCFMMAADLAMILDMEITVPDAEFMEIHTQNPLAFLQQLWRRPDIFTGSTVC